MPNLIYLVEQGDVLAILLLITFGYYIGKAMTLRKGHLQVLGTRVAAAAFLIYLVYGWITYGVSEASVLVSIVWRGGLLYGLTLGFSWIGLTAVDFSLALLKRQIKLAQKRSEDLRRHLLEPQHRQQQQLAEQQEQEERERLAPERDRQRDEAERKQMKKLKLTALRSQKTYEAELLYNKLLKEEQPVFQREAFDRMLEYAFASNDEEAINGRLTMLFDALGASDVPEEPEQGPESMEEIAQTFSSRREEVEACHSYSEQQKQKLLRRLNLEEGHAVQQFINRKIS